MAKKTYTGTTTARKARARSKRLREAGGYGSSGSGIRPGWGIGGDGSTPDWSAGADWAERSGYALESGHARSADEAVAAGTAAVAEELSGDSPSWDIIEAKDAAVLDESKADAAGKYLSKTNADTAQGAIRFSAGLTVGAEGSTSGIGANGDALLRNIEAQGIQIGSTYREGMLGEGGVFKKVGGKTYLEADVAYFRMKAYFDTLEVRRYIHSGGNRVASAAGCNVSRVEWYGVNEREPIAQEAGNRGSVTKFRCYFRKKDNENTINNEFSTGDFAFCEVTNIAEGSGSALDHHRYWRRIVGRGSTDEEYYITLSNEPGGYEAGSDFPVAGDDIVQLGNASDKKRQGAIIERVSGMTCAPTYDIYQNIDSFDLSGKSVISYGFDTATGHAFMNVYGDVFIGDAERSTYIAYDQASKQLTIRAKIDALSPIMNGNTAVGTMGDIASLNSIKTAFNGGTTTIDGGLVLTNAIAMMDGGGDVTAGISGLTDGNTVAAWFGGTPSTAKSLFRFDGSGYLAGGNISWNDSGDTTVQGTIKAKNFFHKVCIFQEEHGEDVPKHHIDGHPSYNTGAADVVFMVPNSRDPWHRSSRSDADTNATTERYLDARTLFLPSPKTYEGKVVDVFVLWRGDSEHSDPTTGVGIEKNVRVSSSNGNGWYKMVTTFHTEEISNERVPVADVYSDAHDIQINRGTGHVRFYATRMVVDGADGYAWVMMVGEGVGGITIETAYTMDGASMDEVENMILNYLDNPDGDPRDPNDPFDPVVRLSALEDYISEIDLSEYLTIQDAQNTYSLNTHDHDGTYLRLSGADVMAGNLKLGAGTAVKANDKDTDLLAYKNSSWGGVTGEHWFVGAAGVNGFIRSAGELKRWKDANTQYRIWDASNLNPDSYLLSSAISDWAKAASKPAYNLDEVLDGTTRKLSDYLALTGGTLKGTLTFAIPNGTHYGAIQTYKNGDNEYLYLWGNEGVLIDGLYTRENGITEVASRNWVNSQGFLTSHQSLANYVTLNGAETITGAKRFTSDIHIGQSAGASPKIYWGDGSYVWIGEDYDDHFMIHATNGIEMDGDVAFNSSLLFGDNAVYFGDGTLCIDTTDEDDNDATYYVWHSGNLNPSDFTNHINSIKVNGTTLVPDTNLAVNIDLSGYATTSQLNAKQNKIHFLDTKNNNTELDFSYLYLPLSNGGGGRVSLDLSDYATKSAWKVKDVDVIYHGASGAIINGDEIPYLVELNSSGELEVHCGYLSIWVPEKTSDLTNDSGFITQTTADGRYLPLSAGSSKPLTGELYISGSHGIQWNNGEGMLVCRPTAGGWTGVLATQWAVGALTAQGVIRSDANDLLHYRSNTAYKIWDAYNFNPANYLPLSAGSDKPLTGSLYFSGNSGINFGQLGGINMNTSTAVMTIGANGGANFVGDTDTPLRANGSPVITDANLQSKLPFKYLRNRSSDDDEALGIERLILPLTVETISGKRQAMLDLSGYLPLTAGSSHPLTGNIAYKGTKATYDMITFIDNVGDIYGNGIAIGGGGATIIGGGESAGTMSGQVSGGNEIMYIGNDQGVSIFTNLQNGWDYRKEFTFYNTGVLSTAGSVVTPNGSGLYIEDTGGTERMAVFVNGSNQFFVGFGMRNAGYTGYFDSNIMYFRSGASGTTMTLDASNRVGIGTTSPSKKLHVNGDALFENWVTIKGNNDSAGLEIVDTNATHDFTAFWKTQTINNVSREIFTMYSYETKYWDMCIGTHPNAVDYGGLYMYNSGNNVLRWGIGTATPDSKLHVVNECHFAGGAKFNNICIEVNNNIAASGRGSEINNYAGTLHLQYNSSTNCTICSGGGNVGIGTRTPSAKLHVVGNSLLNGNVSINGLLSPNNITLPETSAINFGIGGDSYSGALTAVGAGSTIGDITLEASRNLTLKSSSSGKVFVYRGSSQKLEVNSSGLSVTGAVVSSGNITSSGTVKGNTLSGEDIVVSDYFRIYVDKTSTTPANMFFSKYGSWSDSGSSQYNFDGNIRANNLSSGSDIRMKDIVSYMLPSVHDIASAPIIEFKWKSNNELNLGSIAQYWEKVFPQAVHADGSGMLAMEYGNIALASAITAARHSLDNERRIAELELRVAELKSIIENYEISNNNINN